MKTNQTVEKQKYLRVGIVGTGFATKRRAEALIKSDRGKIVAVSGHTTANTAAFAQEYGIETILSRQELVQLPDLDLVFIGTVNNEHGAIVQAALAADKHVVVEYPLSLQPQQAESLINLAQAKGKLLHVEHIEILGGLHQAIKQYLPEIGNVFYARYVTINPQHPAPRRWTYNHQLYGFPLTAALSRIHRFTDLFGQVSTVSCQARFWEVPDTPYYRACLCAAQLRFANSLVAEITYGKGEVFWQRSRHFELHGEAGTLIFDGDRGTLIKNNITTPIAVGTRRGLFARDSEWVFEHLLAGKPLYVSPSASLSALQVADAARQSAVTGKEVALSSGSVGLG